MQDGRQVVKVVDDTATAALASPRSGEAELAHAAGSGNDVAGERVRGREVNQLAFLAFREELAWRMNVGVSATVCISHL